MTAPVPVRPAARDRIALGATGLLLAALPVRAEGVSRSEADLFRLVNGLPDGLATPTVVVMQLGNALAAPGTSVLALLAGRRRLALRLLAAGLGAWAGAKGVKRVIRRGRPAELLPGVRVRGREQAGDGFPSGHAGVAAALAAAALPSLDRRSRPAAVALAAVVGLARLYVGAHLPLDVLGGVAMGWAVEASVGRLLDGRPPGRG